MKTKLGAFKSKIQVIDIVKTKSSTGGVVETPQVLKTFWSKRKEVSGTEDEEGRVRAIFDVAFIVKYSIDFADGKAIGMLVKDTASNVFYKIESIVEIEFRKFLRINAVKHE
jgi:hypothetical protein